MKIKAYSSDLLLSNMYVISENGHAVVIDPFRDITKGEGLTIDLMMVTHEHYDHISGVNAWKEAYNAPLLCSEACAANLGDTVKNQSRHFDVFCELQSWIKQDKPVDTEPDYKCKADMTFNDKTEFEWQGHVFRLYEIPGHSQGSIGIYLDDENFFSGDSLLEGKETELRLPGGSRKQWKELGEPRIKAVPPGTVIFPGHFNSFLKE